MSKMTTRLTEIHLIKVLKSPIRYNNTAFIVEHLKIIFLLNQNRYYNHNIFIYSKHFAMADRRYS